MNSDVSPAWQWGQAPWSARLASTALLTVLYLPAIATALFGAIGGAPWWIVAASMPVLAFITWMWFRVGVTWTGTELVVRSRIRSFSIDESDIVGFSVRRLDPFIPNMPLTISVCFRAEGQEREVQIVATAVREGNLEVRRWYADQFTKIGPGLNRVHEMLYAPSGRRTIFGRRDV